MDFFVSNLEGLYSVCYKVPCYLRPGYFLNSTLRTVFPSQQDDELMKILRRVGPDTLIPCFAVNIRGNKDVQIANEVNQAVFNDLSHISAEETSKRIPLIVTLSTMFHSPTKDPDYLQVKLFGTKLKSLTSFFFVINSWQSWIIVQT